MIWIKGKIRKITQVGRKISIQEKKWKGSVLVVLAQNLFYNWKFQLKISVKTSAKARVLLSPFFSFFLLYSRAILSFSLSPSLLLCAFHCFNCWIILENLSCQNSFGLAYISFFGLWLLLVSLFPWLWVAI